MLSLQFEQSKTWFQIGIDLTVQTRQVSIRYTSIAYMSVVSYTYLVENAENTQNK